MPDPVQIPITQGKVALVDAADAPALLQFKWFAMRNGRHWAVGRNKRSVNRKRGTIYMHQQILGFPMMEIDHRDRNGLNNCRGNLRLATDLQQAINRTCPVNAAGFRGVKKKMSRWTLKKPFEARLRDHGKYLCIGHFATALEAACAYDEAAKRIFGEFAVLNFP